MLDMQPKDSQPAPGEGRNGAPGFDFSPWTQLPASPLRRPAAAPPAAASREWLWLEQIVAALLLVLLLPVMALVALVIKIDSPGGPIFFRQERVGLNRRRGTNSTGAATPTWTGPLDRRHRPAAGQRFLIWKFRTMRPNAEAATGPVWASSNDPRVTRVGQVLRHLRLDELPQLVNVLQGQMRLIGPRPERPEFVGLLARDMPDYLGRLAVPPGITGLAQVEREYDSSVDDVRRKLGYDLFYVEHRCWRLDLKILLKTIDVVVRGRGAH
jgi:lipopolysaccharide/colanic/teichoic acid biosynthesis glycosyltransferase